MPSSRPTTIEELKDVFPKFWNEESRERGLAFQPKAADIIISPSGKCGTTLLQQIAHGLRTRGSMDFDEITDVTPWIEIAYDMGWDLDAPQIAKPRVYKSHLAWYEIPKGARYIISFRHYYDVAVSFYRFFEGWFFEPASITLDEFLDWRWSPERMGTGGYWYHLPSWWEQRHNENVLLLCYEDIQADLPAAIRKIAAFMTIPLDDELLEIVSRQSSRQFMLAHEHQFDDHRFAAHGGKRAGLPTPISSSKVTAGAPKDSFYQLSPERKAALDEIWRQEVKPRIGFETYEDLRQALKELS
jgi:hypothetical protein